MDANAQTREDVVVNQSIEKNKNLVLIEYILFALGLFVFLTAIIAVIMAHIKRSDAAGTWLESHQRWIIRTFWFSFLWGVIGVVTSFFVVGWIILLADWIWVIYRLIKGFLAFNDQKPVYREA